MRFIADLHIHSPYSRATSKDMTLEGIAYWAQLKGLRLMGTGDFTHPEWYRRLEESLEMDDTGFYRLREPVDGVPDICRAEVRFVPTAELSCIYSKGGRTRKIHLLVVMPTLEDAALYNSRLSRIGNLSADGRPVLGLDAKEALRMMLDITDRGLIIPAHAWTPHFSLFGAFSGFDSLRECFEELSDRVYAIETGLSSDPPMNWRVSELDTVRLVSNSDAHSPSRIGREANVFDTEFSYDGLLRAIREGKGLEATIEFFPEEGKYHFDGHRGCGVCLSPEQTVRYNYRCPVCGGELTIGVMHRVIRLADRSDGQRPPQAKPYYSVVPLQEVLAEALKTGVNTKRVQDLYMKLLSELGPEFSILLEVPVEEIEAVGGDVVAEGVRRVREGRVNIRPGFDGQYGRVSIFEQSEISEIRGQGLLF